METLKVHRVGDSLVLIVKEKVPPAVLIPSLSIAALVIVALFTFQIGLHRQRMHLGGPGAKVRRRLAAGKDDIKIAGIEHEPIFQVLDVQQPLATK